MKILDKKSAANARASLAAEKSAQYRDAVAAIKIDDNKIGQGISVIATTQSMAKVIHNTFQVANALGLAGRLKVELGRLMQSDPNPYAPTGTASANEMVLQDVGAQAPDANDGRALAQNPMANAAGDILPSMPVSAPPVHSAAAHFREQLSKPKQPSIRPLYG